MARRLNERSINNLQGVSDKLAAVVKLAHKYSVTGFTVIEGLRTPERQEQLIKAGKSWTKQSRHLTGEAVDIAAHDLAGKISWEWPRYEALNNVMQRAANELGTAIEWGGEWKQRDGVHFQLKR